MATSDGKGTFIVTYTGSNHVTLSQFLPPPQVLSVTKMPNEHFRILFRGYPNTSYRLEASSDLSPDSFKEIATFGVGEGEVFAIEDINSDSYTPHFYRVVFPGPDPEERTARVRGGSSPSSKTGGAVNRPQHSLGSRKRIPIQSNATFYLVPSANNAEPCRSNQSTRGCGAFSARS
jgi:hypothetical protein